MLLLLHLSKYELEWNMEFMNEREFLALEYVLSSYECSRLSDDENNKWNVSKKWRCAERTSWT